MDWHSSSLCFTPASPLLCRFADQKFRPFTYSSALGICRTPPAPDRSTSLVRHVHKTQICPNLTTKCTEDLSAFAPGTTTLLLQVFANAERLAAWTQEWLGEYIFSSQGTLPIPVSQVTNEEEVQLLFYSADLEVRGILAISTESEGLNSAKLRVTSSSRFINEAGKYTSTLPGERRIIRDLFSGVRESFEGVNVLYKPRYFRLRKQMLSKGNPSVHVTTLVCEVRNATRTQVVSFLHNWAFETQFGAEGLSLANVTLPPISVFTFSNGVKVRTQESLSAEIIAHVREKGMVISRQAEPLDQDDLNQLRTYSPRTIVVVSATYPEKAGTRAVMRSLSLSLFRRYPNTRIHASSRS
ncbi:hypothetical protein BWQ96_03063 [Gracilariopsis chorda]|uniref:Uncharacterized protein n=1 Tax=Gracilariopsis chorda TaxID=448386 RepID=A0A2V3IYC5_9FLOR|nr:hypothetical protein BWQ96_03063 [Gracilariopsis chorda]|eukprot:PXF47121.1 hypothetical protein BWQ96_03063 [Gracilariopsis chorda]